jgi:Glyoxalase/Bleomycin resistance protein/Dioxygenase superfamily
MMTEHPRPDIRDIRLLGIPVTDQDPALRFYTETLGFELQMDVPLPQRGLQVGDVLRWPGVPAIFHVHDIDGNRFELVE